jgi:hypothetical protein
MKAVVCKVGEKPEIVELSDNGETAFEEVRKLVGGYVTRVRMGKFDMYCDEDGLPKELPLNRVVAGEPIVGTFVVIRYSPQWLVGLTDNEATWLVKDLDTDGCLLKPLEN